MRRVVITATGSSVPTARADSWSPSLTMQDLFVQVRSFARGRMTALTPV
jgi:hypothetical protein